MVAAEQVWTTRISLQFPREESDRALRILSGNGIVRRRSLEDTTKRAANIAVERSPQMTRWRSTRVQFEKIGKFSSGLEYEIQAAYAG